jgi:hypothetical protein
MADDGSDDDYTYEVGYGKPPKHSQFKPGICPNKKGRGKGTKNLRTEIEEELRKKITTQENGLRKKITKSRAIAKQLVNQNVTGNLKTLPILLNETRDTKAEGNLLQVIFDTPDDEAVMANLIERIRKQSQNQNEPVPPTDDGAEHTYNGDDR